MRRIVLGHESNQATVLADGEVEPVTVGMLPGVEIHRMWELDETPTLPVTDVQEPSKESYFPGPGGIRLGYITVPPHISYEMPPGLSEDEIASATAEAEEKLPGMSAAFDPERPGMHATRSVDFVVVFSGQGRLRTDNDVEIELRQGDCVIQNGTSHVWLNESDEPFILCYALCGAK